MSHHVRLVCAVIVVVLAAVGSANAAITNFWRMNEGAGGTTANAAGGTIGTINNQATGGTGSGGNAWITNDPFRGTVLSFNNNDATGAYVSAGTIPQTEINGNFTWAFWGAIDAGTGGNDVVIGNRFGGPGGAWTKFTPTNYEWSPNGNVNMTDMPMNSSWHHYAVVKNGTSFQTYVDGFADASATGFANTFSGAVPFFMGGDSGGERIGGRLDNVATFNTALTQAEIRAIRAGDYSAYGQGTSSVLTPLQTSSINTTGFTVSAVDLLNGISPVVSGNPNALNPEEGRTSNNAALLTNGVFGPANAPVTGTPEVVAIHDNTVLTYTLPAYVAGYDITGINGYTGWNDAGRDDQDYLVSVALQSDPNTFIPLADVLLLSGGNDTSVVLSPSTGLPMATGVVAVRFTFAGTENGFVGYREFDVFGTRSAITTNLPEPGSIALWTMLGLAGGAFGWRTRRGAKAKQA